MVCVPTSWRSDGRGSAQAEARRPPDGHRAAKHRAAHSAHPASSPLTQERLCCPLPNKPMSSAHERAGKPQSRRRAEPVSLWPRLRGLQDTRRVGEQQMGTWTGTAGAWFAEGPHVSAGGPG